MATNDNVGLATCRIKYSSSISDEMIAVIVSSVILASMCFSLCSVCVSFVVCLRKRTKSSMNDDSASSATEMTRSTMSTQPIPPPRPSDLPPLSTPTTSGFSPSFSPFSPFESIQPLPPPRPQNLSSLTTPTKPLDHLFSPFPMPAVYESTPVYIAPGSTGRPIYIEPSKMAKEELLSPPPFYPNCVNHYEKTPTESCLTRVDSSCDHYESIPSAFHNTYIDSTDLQKEKEAFGEVFKDSHSNDQDEDKYEKLEQPTCCYDNLEPRDDVDGGAGGKMSGKEERAVVNSYVNLEEVEKEIIPPAYDTLRPALSCNSMEESNTTSSLNCSNTQQQCTSAVDESPQYENMKKE